MPWKLRYGLAGGLGFGALALLVFFLGNSVGRGIGHFAARYKDRRERCIFAESRKAYPGFTDCAAPGRVDNADRDVLARGDVAGEVPGNGGEFLRGLGS